MSDVAIRDVVRRPRRSATDAAAAAGPQRREHLGLAVVLLVGGALLVSRLHDGWFPHDEGALGQAAERILLGQVPHRDFDDMYTGLLSYIHAAAFHLLSTSSQVMRLPLLVAGLLWTATVYRLFLRFAPSTGAAALAILVLVWSVPNYAASMPSWYNLFCATWGLAALFRWTDDGRFRWLFLAGFFGGLSFLFKLTGLFFVIAAAIGVTAVTASRGAGQPRGPRLWSANLAVTLAYAACAAGLTLAVGTTGSPEWTRFVLPMKVLLLAFVVREWTVTGGTAGRRMKEAAGSVSSLLLGAALPIGAYLAFYAAADALPALVEGVFVKPFQRVGFAQVSPPPPTTALLAVPFILLLSAGTVPRWGWRIIGVVAAVAMLLLLALSGTDPLAYRMVWFMAWSQHFVACALGTLVALGLLGRGRGLSDRGVEIVILASVVAAFAVLVEYPFAAPIYTLYALPLAVIAIVAAVRITNRPPLAAQWVLVAFFMAFGLLRVLPNATAYLGAAFIPVQYPALLDVPRGGIWVTAPAAEEYTTVINLVREHGRDRIVWAGPDAPEIYFYGEALNHTRVMFDFFSPRPAAESFVDYMEEVGADMVVIKRYPGFTPAVSAEALTELAARYRWVQATPSFFVLWR